MQLGMIGLGRMGGNMVRRLLKAGHACVVFDLNELDLKRLRTGQKLELTARTYPDHTFHGQISFIAPELQVIVDRR